MLWFFEMNVFDNLSSLSYTPSGLCSDSGVFLHVAGQFLCLGQGSVWGENGHWSRWGAAPYLCLQSPDQQVCLSAWTTLVRTQHLSGRFTGCVSQLKFSSWNVLNSSNTKTVEIVADVSVKMGSLKEVEIAVKRKRWKNLKFLSVSAEWSWSVS